MTATTPTTCKTEVEFDVGLYAMCTLSAGHRGAHQAQLDAIGGITTAVTWGGADPADH